MSNTGLILTSWVDAASIEFVDIANKKYVDLKDMPDHMQFFKIDNTEFIYSPDTNKCYRKVRLIPYYGNEGFYYHAIKKYEVFEPYCHADRDKDDRHHFTTDDIVLCDL